MGLVAVDTPFFHRGDVQLTTQGSPPWRREAYLLGLGIRDVRLANSLYGANPLAAEPGSQYSDKKGRVANPPWQTMTNEMTSACARWIPRSNAGTFGSGQLLRRA